MTPAAATRLAEIAATQAALADEAQRILAAMAGAAPGEQVPDDGNFEPDAPCPHMRTPSPDGPTVPDIRNEAQDAGENTAMASFTTPDAPEHPAMAAPSPAKTTKPHLVALKKAAGNFGMSDRRMSRWAQKHGALRKLSGRLMVDVAALERHF